MNSEVIKEIANQLGLAIEDTGQFLTYILPEYAKIKCMYCGFGLMGIILTSFIIIFSTKKLYSNFIEVRKKGVVKYDRILKTERIIHDLDLFDTLNVDMINWFYFVNIIIGTILLIISIAMFIYSIGWFISPEGMFFDMVMNKIA